MSRPFRLLKASIEAGDLNILQKRVQSLEKPFQDALCVAAREGFVEAVPLLWDRLSPSGQQRFLEAKNSNVDDNDNDDHHGYLPPLHEAVKHNHLDMVSVLVGAFEFNINQEDIHGRTPLFYATKSLEITRFLLENGANATHMDVHGRTPIYNVIQNGMTEILSILLKQGGVGVGWNVEEEVLPMTARQTSLNKLLCNNDISRETKVDICRLLVNHAVENRDTLLFLQSSLEYAVEETSIRVDEDDYIHLLLEAGMVPSSQALYIAIRGEDVSLCQSLVRHGADPFLLEPEDLGDYVEAGEDEEDPDPTAAASPFLAAVRLSDILIFDYFLDLWHNEHFLVTSQGRNASGDYPLHVICRDPYVSLQVIVLMVARHADAVMSLSGLEHLLPFQIASMANADLDVIFYLLKLCPHALCRLHPLAVMPPGNTNIGANGQQKKTKAEARDGSMGIIALLRDENESLRVEKDAAAEAMKTLQAEIEKLQQALAATATR
jgi:ankyrin repeat protein